MNGLAFLSLAAATLLGGCATTGSYGDDGWGYYDRGYSQRYGNYDWVSVVRTFGASRGVN